MTKHLATLGRKKQKTPFKKIQQNQAQGGQPSAATSWGSEKKLERKDEKRKQGRIQHTIEFLAQVTAGMQPYRDSHLQEATGRPRARNRPWKKRKDTVLMACNSDI